MSNKECSTCNLIKPADQFRSGKGQCLPCYRTRVNAWHRRKLIESPEFRLKAAERKREIIKANLAYVRSVKDMPCSDCGVTYQYWVMQFDHVRGVKSANIANMASKVLDMSRIKAEIDKCDVVCANCHATRTHGRITGLFPKSK